MSSSNAPRRKLVDYTKRGKHISQQNDEHDFPMRSFCLPLQDDEASERGGLKEMLRRSASVGDDLHDSCSSFESFDFSVETAATDNIEQDPVSFYLKIPSKESRRAGRRKSDNLRKRFCKKRSEKNSSLIDTVLQEPVITRHSSVKSIQSCGY